MKYFNYSLDSLMDYPAFNRMIEHFIRIANDEKMESMLKHILLEGGIDDYSLSTTLQRRDSPSIEMMRRVSMAYVLVNNPETFEYFKENKINVFHGTNAYALPSILKYGLNNVGTLKEKEIAVTTGEEWSRIMGKRSFISFTDVFEIAQEYSFIPPALGNNVLNIPIVIGTREEDIRKSRFGSVASDISEIGVFDEVYGIEKIKCLCVPDDKIGLVEMLVGNKDIKVLGLSNIDKKFYYMVDTSYIEYSPELVSKPIPEVTEKEVLEEDELLEVAKSRKASRMKRLITKIKEIFKGEVEYEYSGRTK